MKEKTKNIVVIAVFLCIIFGFSLANIIVKDKDVSTAERRKLKQVPKVTIDKIMSSSLSDEYEDYFMDQFVLRDKFRSLKTFVKLDVLKQLDNNELFQIEDNIYKMQYPLNDKSVKNVSDKINNIHNKYLTGIDNVYYSVIPDKNYFLDEESLYLKIDYNKMIDILKENVNKDISYIDITDKLNSESYYNTDTHWMQQNIIPVRDTIAESMGFKDRLNLELKQKEYGEFYGTLYGQLGNNSIKPDTIYYLTNDIIENSIAYNYETGKEMPIYSIEKADKSMDKYDLFLSGATPLIEIRNKEALTDRELILFRDSYSSSLAPLVTEAYSKIILIDTRYMPTDLIQNYIQFNNNQDVLFIYSTLLINESGVLK